VTKKAGKQRIDLLLVERELEVSRERARARILAGEVRVGTTVIDKPGTMVALEASARFRETGADPAIQFAEKQTSPQFAKDAARGVWWSLAQQDRGSALQWIESLPAGPFRDGALNSVMQEASFRTRSWGETEEVVKAGTELRSTRTKLDYFTSLAQQRRADGSTQSEFVGKLAIPEAEKMELRRRLAPIPLR
jgi:ribosomal protein S4